jgi:hypothetical protein
MPATPAFLPEEEGAFTVSDNRPVFWRLLSNIQEQEGFAAVRFEFFA